MSRQLILTAIWWVWEIVLILALVLLSMQPALFGSDVPKVWQWFLPNLVPTLTMVGVTAYVAPPSTAVTAPSSVFLLALATSVLYLMLLSLSILATLFEAHPLQSMQQSSLWLGPIQGFAASGLAVYFAKR